MVGGAEKYVKVLCPMMSFTGIICRLGISADLNSLCKWVCDHFISLPRTLLQVSPDGTILAHTVI